MCIVYGLRAKVVVGICVRVSIFLSWRLGSAVERMKVCCMDI